ncbi:hypothetical protein Moror_9219 [Moniliophthora roreri MCA 2997]|uniref:DRBM domain-containing protein n=1 Tax=Moniliophthora roreri (strain MCA 2997) TaxID=1381753 RepID=V2WTR0_MONRO|nr:hypothetical protein Moror_9219 [Moniliophthora roreri MCA 2997]KAI3614278.1 hypothetical protein WG66_000100 [Moniliophthora roreri]
MPGSRTHNKMHLNNYCQGAGIKVDWDTKPTSGTQHSPVWSSKVYLNNVCYGRGQAGTKHGAEEEAAGEALDTLNRS